MKPKAPANLKAPVVRDNDFDSHMDPPINSGVLERLFKQIFGVHFVPAKKPEDEAFTAGHPWLLRIEDKHDDEKKPHYVYEIGEVPKKMNEKDEEVDDFSGLVHSIFEVRYLDYHSVPKDKKKKGKKAKKNKKAKKSKKTEQKHPGNTNHAPGYWLIELWLPKQMDPAAHAKDINIAYGNTMNAVLKDYYILYDEKPKKIKKKRW